MSRYDVALLMHLVGVIMFFAGIALAAVAFGSAMRRTLPSEIAAVLAHARIGVIFVALGTLLLLPFGFWLTDLAGHEVGDGWISASLALLVVSAALGGVAGQKAKRARLLAQELRQSDDRPSEELSALLRDPLSLVLNVAASVAAVAVLVLMVWRPGS